MLHNFTTLDEVKKFIKPLDEFEATKNIYYTPTTHVTALLDLNGYILASNQGNKYVGRFIGEIQGKLMQHLSNVNISVFKRVDLDDTQAECPVSDEFNSASSTLLNPAKLIFKAISMTMKSMYLIGLNLSMFIISMFQYHEVHGQTRPTINISCVKTMPLYIYQPDKWKEIYAKKELKLVICGKEKGCTQSFAIKEIKNTNMILLVATTPCHGKCKDLRTTTKHVKREDVNICEQKERYRRQPFKCYNATVDDEDKRCGRGSMTQPSLWILLAILIFGYAITTL